MVDNLDKVFEIVPNVPIAKRVKLDVTNDVANTDFNYTRENLYNIIERGADAMEGILQVAQETEHPRAYEVVEQLMDKLTSANKELMGMHKQIKEIKQEKLLQPQSVTNALFIGSTADLQKMLKTSKES